MQFDFFFSHYFWSVLLELNYISALIGPYLYYHRSWHWLISSKCCHFRGSDSDQLILVCLMAWRHLGLAPMLPFLDIQNVCHTTVSKHNAFCATLFYFHCLFFVQGELSMLFWHALVTKLTLGPLSIVLHFGFKYMNSNISWLKSTRMRSLKNIIWKW